jgi:DHA2 family multidrug resistance protein
MLTSHLTAGDESYRVALGAGSQLLYYHGRSWADALSSSVALVSKTLEQQALMLSYIDAFWVIAIVSFLAAPIALLIRREKTVLTELPPEAH